MHLEDDARTPRATPVRCDDEIISRETPPRYFCFFFFFVRFVPFCVFTRRVYRSEFSGEEVKKKKQAGTPNEHNFIVVVFRYSYRLSRSRFAGASVYARAFCVRLLLLYGRSNFTDCTVVTRAHNKP